MSTEFFNSVQIVLFRNWNLETEGEGSYRDLTARTIT